MSDFISGMIEGARAEIAQFQEEIRIRELVVDALQGIDTTLKPKSKTKLQSYVGVKRKPKVKDEDIEKWIKEQYSPFVVKDVAERFDLSTSSVRPRMSKFIKAGLVRERRNGGATSPIKYHPVKFSTPATTLGLGTAGRTSHPSDPDAEAIRDDLVHTTEEPK